MSHVSALCGVKGERVALRDVNVRATLHDLLCEVSTTQTYRNEERVSIEAVYTFPLPLDAVLLELEVKLGERLLHGVVVEKKDAEQQYERAVEAGDSAVMLEQLEPGLYTMNVGNLLPNETASITIRYAVMHRWAGDGLRLMIPTTIAPRYGAPRHQPHQTPETSLVVENQFALEVEVRGSLREGQFHSPSHQVTLVRDESRAVISLRQERASMDRDFVLQLKAPRASKNFALSGTDGDGVTTIASFQPFFSGLQQKRPLSLGLVIDCSGSMQGDSIEQAKRALSDILGLLAPTDRLSILAFGSTTVAFSDKLLSCTEETVGRARDFVRQLDANLGGTEIGVALTIIERIIGSAENADVFLITDGEVSDWERVVADARRTGHRHFTVGVGSAVAEPFVRGLADNTGGACELVSPNEAMSERIVRHFERMRAPRAARVAVRWPPGATDVAPAVIGSVFEGDTFVASARFERPLSGAEVVLEVETMQGELVRQALPLPVPTPEVGGDRISTVARVGAAMRLASLDERAARATALRYRLTSRWTNVLVIAARSEEEKSLEMPVLRKVPQTMAAGWGGTGTNFLRVASMAPPAPMRSEAPLYSPVAPQQIDAMDIPTFIRDQMSGRPGGIDHGVIPDAPHRGGDDAGDGNGVIRLVALCNDNPTRLSAEFGIDLLREARACPDFDALLSLAVEAGVREATVAVIILGALLSAKGLPVLNSKATRAAAVLIAEARRLWKELYS
ncbi:MAG: VIT domain-containing protein, partial [Gemmatimonadaceae bacterium]